MATAYNENMNRKMKRFVPELESEYATYPLQRTRWLDLKEKGPKGEPMWIKGPQSEEIKMDYVFGAGPYGRCYYHLLTKYSYSNLYARHVNVPPVGCCACSKESRQTYDEWDDVKRLLHARSVASIPNDEVARNDQLNGAKDTAQMWHNGLQNEQLAVNIVQTGVNLNA